MNVPIIPCFVEMIAQNKKDNDEFYKLNYILHILPAIYSNPEKSVKENAEEMMEKDYNAKKTMYEKAYNKKLDYTFEYSDIAGLIQN